MNKMLAAVLLLSSPSAFAAAPRVAIVIDDFGRTTRRPRPPRRGWAPPGG